jgi:uncharacterized protein
MMTEIQDMVQFVAKSLADKPEDVEITESVGEGVIMIEIRVAPEDMGRLIGRQGRTINAIRSLARVLGAKSEKKVSVEII